MIYLLSLALAGGNGCILIKCNALLSLNSIRNNPVFAKRDKYFSTKYLFKLFYLIVSRRANFSIILGNAFKPGRNPKIPLKVQKSRKLHLT